MNPFGYCISTPYGDKPLVEEEIRDPRLIKKLDNYSFRSEKYKRANQKYGYLTQFLKSPKLKINEAGAYGWLNDKYTADSSAYKRNQILIHRIKNSDYHFSLADHGDRFYSSVGMMNKELRPFLSWEQKRFVEVDISSCLFSTGGCLFNENFWDTDGSKVDFTFKNVCPEVYRIFDEASMCSDYPCNTDSIYSYISTYSIMVGKSMESEYSRVFKDMRLYFDLVSGGQFYDYMRHLFSSECHPKYRDRREVKRELLIVVNCKNNRINVKSDDWVINPSKIFQQEFPSVYWLFHCLKMIDNAHAAWLFHSIESWLVLKVISKRFIKKKPGVPIITIHDCIATTEGNEDHLHEIMRDELKRYIGFEPTLKIKHW
ncbi:hypothetical protein QFZ51_002723 [Chitinophaga sp. W3I9]|uniref:hypothetical protein n=1 Tax=Chitinophaga sp. W3I9 TaxID=3373924 RepID=UPI003D24119A